MTTILVDRTNLIMGADKQTTYGQLGAKGANKISRYVIKRENTEILCASCGDSEAGVAWDEWITRYCELGPGEELPDHPTFTDVDFNGIILTQHKKLYLYMKRGYPIEIKERFFGCGSGSEYGLGSLHSGATVRRAIQVASKLDIGTGKGIQIESLQPK